MIRTIAAGVILSASLATASIAGPIDPATVMELELFATIDDPVGIASAPGDFSRVFVYSNTGVIYVVRDGVLLPDPFLDISSEINSSGEKGFFSLVFHPDYQANGTFFIQYTPFFNVDLVLEKVQRLNADQADPSTRDIIHFNNPPTQSHYGGWMAFHPIDGYLYIGVGDGGPPSVPPIRAQQLDNKMGKILRIDVDGDDFVSGFADFAIPPDNPFVGQAGVLPEIFAYGLRQPWRCSFDRETGDLYIGEVGRLFREEVNIIPNGVGGLNFGWPCIEGFDCSPFPGCDCATVDATAPAHAYPRTVGRCIIGGYRYRGCELPELEGKYFFADFVDGKVFMADVSADLTTLDNVQDITSQFVLGGNPMNTITSWGEDAYGELYIADRNSDSVFKVVRADATPVNDCNNDGIEDNCQILDGTLADTNANGTPDVCDTNVCIGDCDGNGTVEFNDLVAMLFVFGQAAPATCDADESGTVGFNDLVTALFLFGPCP